MNKTLIIFATILMSWQSLAAEVSVGTDGLSLEIPTQISNLAIKASFGQAKAKLNVKSSDTNQKTTFTEMRLGALYGKTWQGGVFLDLSKAEGWFADKSIGGKIKEKISVNKFSFYLGRKFEVYNNLTVNFGAQILPFVKYEIVDSTVPYDRNKEIADAKGQLSKYRIGNTFVQPVINLGYQF